MISVTDLHAPSAYTITQLPLNLTLYEIYFKMPPGP
jgi:hypothetical protein